MLVGLGNPGSKYTGTRHNVGFDVLDRIHARYGNPTAKLESNGKVARVELGAAKLMLVWPQTYMNHSGRCVQPLASYYKIDTTTDLLVVCDDLNLPLGKIRIRPKGSAGGQKGLADILRALGGEDVPRMRIGIDSAPDNWDAVDYVLARFTKGQQPVIDEALDTASSAAESWCQTDLQTAMNQFNA